jgi:hypothetical protein
MKHLSFRKKSRKYHVFVGTNCWHCRSALKPLSSMGKVKSTTTNTGLCMKCYKIANIICPICNKTMTLQGFVHTHLCKKHIDFELYKKTIQKAEFVI